MNPLDKLIDSIKTHTPLKSETIFNSYKAAQENLDKNLLVLSDIIERLNKEQLDNLNLKVPKK